MTYSQKVVFLLENRKISGYRLAKDMEFEPNVVANWLSRVSVPHKYALKIADYLEVDLRSLLDDEMEVVSLEGSD